MALDIEYMAARFSVDLASWNNKTEEEKLRLAAVFTSAKDWIDLQKQFGTISPFGENFGKDAYRTVKEEDLLR